MKNNKGFTLIEMMIVISISWVVAMGFYVVYSSTVKSHEVQEQKIAMYQNIRSGLFLMAREIRMIGYDYALPNLNPPAGIVYDITVPANPALPGVPAIPTATSLTFAYVADNDGIDNNGVGGVDEQGEQVIVTFSLMDNDADGDADDLVRTDLSGPVVSTNTIAENIERLEFSYAVFANGVVTNTLTPQPQDANNIESVRVTILARASKINKDLPDNRRYTSPGSGVIWQVPANDQFSRQMMSTVIKCRNI